MKPPLVDNPYVYESSECREFGAFSKGKYAQRDADIKWVLKWVKTNKLAEFLDSNGTYCVTIDIEALKKMAEGG